MESMTGYGFYEIQVEEGHLQIEVRSVNHRYLEIRTHLPETSNYLENLLMKRVKEIILRGRVDLYLYYTKNLSSFQIIPDIHLAQEYMKAWKTLCHGLKMKGEVKIEWLLQKEELFTIERKERRDTRLEEMIEEAAEGALNNLIAMRREEGERLKVDLLQAIEELEVLRRRMEWKRPQILASYRERLVQRLEDLLKGRRELLDEDRLTLEVAIMAERTDSTEEIARIESHLLQLRETLDLEEKIQGRKIDFIAQELNREVNTIGSKVADTEMINWVIEMKSQIDRIREQAKNIQ